MRNRKLAIVLVFVVVAVIVAFAYHSSQSKKHQESLLEQQQAAFNKTATADPILKNLPYGTLDYNINPTFKLIKGKRQLVLIVSVILDGADYKSSPQQLQASINQREQSARDYIKSLGFDPSKYNIEYSVPAH